MKPQKPIPSGAIFFLYVVAGLADASKLLLDFVGIGLIVDPVFITPITTAVFWITLNHNSIPMFSGRNGWAAWTNETVSVLPGIDALPDWLSYTTYLVVSDRAMHYVHGMVGFIQGIL